MSQAFTPGWVDAVCHAVSTKDEATRSEALGLKPRRCFRSSGDEFQKSRSRGSRRGPASRYALKNLPPVDEEEP
jgi:hypothetical protein